MAFPDDPVPLIGEFLISGTWVDITEDIRGGGDVVRIERGRRDVQGAASPTSASFTLDNRDGTWTDENPLSPYYGSLPLYMPCRIRVAGQDSYLFTNSFYNADYAYTADKAQLDISGDIDIRADIDPTGWQVSGVSSTVTAIMSKSGSVLGQYSWYFGLSHQGELYFSWSPTGNIGDARGFLSSPLAGVTGRRAVRVTLDVDNGAAGFTVRFYTAATIDGAWTLVSSETSTPVTSIHGGTGQVQITALNGSETFSNSRMLSGRVYAAQIYNSAGTKVADADFRAQDIDTTSFADGLGNTWLLQGAALIANDGVRFWGETQSLPQEWDSTSIENVSRATAFDLLQRLSIDQAQLESPLRQTIPQFNPTLYLPGEDASGATQIFSAAEGSTVVQTENVAFQGDEGPDGSDGAWSATGADTYVRALARREAHTGISNATWFYKVGALPAPADGDVRFMYTYASVGTVRRWFVYLSAIGHRIEGYDGGGNLILGASGLFIAGYDPLAWTAMNIEVSISAGIITATLAYFNTDGDGSGTAVITATSAAGMVGGNQDAMIFDAAEALTDISFAHSFITVDPDYQFTVSQTMGEAASGFSGEKAGDRFERLCRTAGIPYELEGWADITVPMGRQRVTTLVDSLQECADTDGGILLGSRRQLGLLMVAQKAIAQRPEVVNLSHSASELSVPPRPVRDSYGRMNDVTVTRANGGGSTRRVITDGAYGTDRIGIVPGGAVVNVETDADTAPVAGFMAALGTWEARRIESIAVQLNRSQTLLGGDKATALLSVDPGRFLSISDFPSHQSPDTSEQLVQGYVETIVNMAWEIIFTGTPYGPWRTEDLDSLDREVRFAAQYTTIGTAMDTTVTTLMLNTSGGDPLWATVALVPTMTFDFDIVVGGERMTITNITGGATPQTATVVRSVNGIVKSHASGTPVQLFNVPYFGR